MQSMAPLVLADSAELCDTSGSFLHRSGCSPSSIREPDVPSQSILTDPAEEACRNFAAASAAEHWLVTRGLSTPKGRSLGRVWAGRARCSRHLGHGPAGGSETVQMTSFSRKRRPAKGRGGGYADPCLRYSLLMYLSKRGKIES